MKKSVFAPGLFVSFIIVFEICVYSSLFTELRMDNLIKTIRKLSEDEYNALLEEISANKYSKPYIVLETARTKELSDSQMIDLLGVNPSTYYTLKSRLNSKVATILAKKVDNPISVLLDEVTRVPANLYGTNKQVAIRALKELEKQLLEYDLSNELINVYRLHMYNPEYDHYDRLYNKFVAFSLASVKAENLLYDFIKNAGIYQLSRDEATLENMQSIIRELDNICELYDSHRLFVIFNIVRIYYLCTTTDKVEALQSKEMEIDKTLQEIRTIFNKYPLDTLYKNIKFIVDCLYFEYYQRIKYTVRARHYYSQVNEIIPDLAAQHILCFHVVQFLEAKLGLFLSTGELGQLDDLNERLIDSMDIDKDEVYHYVSFKRFLAICKFYEGDYAGAARMINSLRNEISLKQFWHTEVDCKLFQALQYALLGEEELCQQITNSISRYVREEKDGFKNIKIFIKLLKASLKNGEGPKRQKKLSALWDSFLAKNNGKDSILQYLNLNEGVMKKLAAPEKR